MTTAHILSRGVELFAQSVIVSETCTLSESDVVCQGVFPVTCRLVVALQCAPGGEPQGLKTEDNIQVAIAAGEPKVGKYPHLRRELRDVIKCKFSPEIQVRALGSCEPRLEIERANRTCLAATCSSDQLQVTR